MAPTFSDKIGASLGCACASLGLPVSMKTALVANATFFSFQESPITPYHPWVLILNARLSEKSGLINQTLKLAVLGCVWKAE